MFALAGIFCFNGEIRGATLAVGSEPKAVAIADFNNDGKKDLAVVNRGLKNISILLGNGAGNFGAATNFPATADNFAEPFSLAVDDFASFL